MQEHFGPNHRASQPRCPAVHLGIVISSVAEELKRSVATDGRRTLSSSLGFGLGLPRVGAASFASFEGASSEWSLRQFFSSTEVTRYDHLVRAPCENREGCGTHFVEVPNKNERLCTTLPNE